MAIRIAVNHVTSYRYDRPVAFSPHVVRLRPAPHCRTPIVAYSLRVSPTEHFLNWQQDPFGNHQARLVFPRPARELKVEVDLVADLTTINPFDFFLDEQAEQIPFRYDPAAQTELAPYLVLADGGGLLQAFTERVQEAIALPGRRSVDVLVDINRLVQRTLRYDVRMEPGVFAPEETLVRGHGSCRDFAWLMVQLLRRLGIAARFVSGYSVQLKADRRSQDGPQGVAEDVTDLHAWAEAYLPGAGWVGLDATSGLMCGEGHIPLACTAEPSSAAPISGSFSWDRRHEDEKLEEAFDFRMEVRRLDDPPRPSKPYDERTWQAILACGDRVDEALVRMDVRLTMGGEPTFVSIDDRDAEEWNTAALGPRKLAVATRLAHNLQRRFAPGGLMHHGQGKWYPGEPLPRWAISCYFRQDGEPIWRDPALFADGRGVEQAGEREARAFGEALCRRLGLAPSFLVPAYEDVFYYLWRERRLPVNVDPLDARLEDAQERTRLRRIFEQGLGKVVGLALPLAAESDPEGREPGVRFGSGPWVLRDGRLYLLPGDSPMGLRLPLDALPWARPEDTAMPIERDPFAPRQPLAPRAVLSRASGGPGRPALPPRPGPQEPPRPGRSAEGVVRTALCLEPREGTLHVFFPPLAALEEYLELTAAIEDTAAQCKLPVRLEGYHPPGDHRLQRLQVTPDPGVLEVNIHPARTWRQLVDNTTALYEEAQALRLGTDKFMIDGRHTGTGGGNHLVLGGATPADSPLLRRPDLLASLATYWLNHPSLSYLFSGLFIGPTSQAPRVDEARHDSLYELEIALRQLAQAPARPGPPAPWLVDRMFRNLFIDVTGNTHRTELCIDKLFSPDAASGRQGLLELRAFEMPPDARMSAAAQLLVRGLTAWFWREPYTRPPVRWGTSLIDRFMLPHYVAQDFGDVLGELTRAGFPFDSSFFSPQFEFRFPLYGRVQAGGVELELRHALEPWHVMGEEPGPGGVVRFVDSSVERLQVLVRGALGDRHLVTCNGRAVPLAATATREERVAGIRFRAWQPPSSLHPGIGVHAPLVFDVLDTWAGRSLGGCTYHVAHPGGRAYDHPPTNALEAESRRVARFFPFGHTPGPFSHPVEERNPELPHTLDLRRPVSPAGQPGGQHRDQHGDDDGA
jgi:uncharacterized protein (DUF2126 family)/transglutaminase-like putative cysteine protease